MAYEDSLLEFEEYIDESNLLQTSDDTTIVNGKRSIRRLVKETVGKTGVLWSSVPIYLKDDEVTEDGDTYICLLVNTNKQPSLNPNEWKLHQAEVVAGTIGFDKKLRFSKDGVISSGLEDFTVTPIGNGSFRCTFTYEEPSIIYGIFVTPENTVQTAEQEKFNIVIVDKQTTHFDIKSYSYTDNTDKDADFYNILILRGT